MFRYIIRHRRGPSAVRLVVGCAAIFLLTLMILAQASIDHAENQYPYASLIAYVLSAIAVFGILGNVVWSFFNRKSYDKLKESLADAESVIEMKEYRIEELTLTMSQKEALHKQVVSEMELDITGLKINNKAMVSQNLQAKAVLKMLRQAGKWDGHEDDLFDQYKK